MVITNWLSISTGYPFSTFCLENNPMVLDSIYLERWELGVQVWCDENDLILIPFFFQVTPQTPTCMFPIDYSAMNSTEEDLEPYRPDKLLEKKGSRRSVLVWYLFKQNHLLTKRNRGQKLLKKQHIKNHVIVLILTF